MEEIETITLKYYNKDNQLTEIITNKKIAIKYGYTRENQIISPIHVFKIISENADYLINDFNKVYNDED